MILGLRNWLLAVLASFGALALFAPTVIAQTPEDCQDTTSPWYGTTFCQNQVKPGDDPVLGSDSLIGQILSIIVVVVTIASVITIVISGMRYVTSGGDPQSSASARQGLIYALVGLAVAAVAQSIVALVLNRL